MSGQRVRYVTGQYLQRSNDGVLCDRRQLRRETAWTWYARYIGRDGLLVEWQSQWIEGGYRIYWRKLKMLSTAICAGRNKRQVGIGRALFFLGLRCNFLKAAAGQQRCSDKLKALVDIIALRQGNYATAR